MWKQKCVLRDRLDGDISHQCQHHPLSRTQVVKRLRVTCNGKDDLFAVGVKPQAVSLCHTAQYRTPDNLETGPHAPSTVAGRRSLAMKPFTQFVKADAFVETVVEGGPTTGNAVCLRLGGKALIGRQPGTACAVIGQHRANDGFARCIPSVDVPDDVARLPGEELADLRLVPELAAALAVAASIVLMGFSDTEHPPAAGTALGFAVVDFDATLLLVLAVSIAALVVAQQLLLPRLRDLL